MHVQEGYSSVLVCVSPQFYTKNKDMHSIGIGFSSFLIHIACLIPDVKWLLDALTCQP